MEEKTQDITGVIKNSKVTQIEGGIHIHIHRDYPSYKEIHKSKLAYLIYYDRENKEKRIEINDELHIYRADKGWNIVGKADKEMDLNVMDASISRKKHAFFYIKNGRVYVEDMNSKNGVYVNGKKVKKKKLEEGDEIRIGSYLTFRLEYYPDKITTRELKPIYFPDEAIMNNSKYNEYMIKTEKGYSFLPVESGKYKIGNKILEVKESNLKEKLENVKTMIVDNTPTELIKKAIDIIAENIKSEEAEILNELKGRNLKDEQIKEELIKTIEQIINDLP